MRRRLTWCLAVGLAAMAGCSRQPTNPCEPDARYSTARSAPPVQIPDDLSPPNEADALRLPPPAGATASTAAGECLEAPPSFFGESRPFRVDAEEDRGARREARRARREAQDAREQAPGEQPAADPAEPRETPPAAEDRVITD